MKKLIHIFIIIFSIFSLNIQATNMLFDYNNKCEHIENKESKHNHSENKQHKECCDEKQCEDCFECKLCTNYVKIFLNINFTEYQIKDIAFYQYSYHVKEFDPKKFIIPPIV